MAKYLDSLESQARDIRRAIIENPECSNTLLPKLWEVEEKIDDLRSSIAA